MAVQAHAQKVSCVQLITENVYVTGSDEGIVKIWRVPSDSDSRWERWKPNADGEEGDEEDEDVSSGPSASLVGSASAGEEKEEERRTAAALAASKHIDGNCGPAVSDIASSSSSRAQRQSDQPATSSSDCGGARRRTPVEDADPSEEPPGLPVVGMWREQTEDDPLDGRDGNGFFGANNNQTIVLVGSKKETLARAEVFGMTATDRDVIARSDEEAEEGAVSNMLPRGRGNEAGVFLKPLGTTEDDDKADDDDLHRAFF
eukprot:GHVS01107999.1.p1 GENE.GHVS01107999.1~~GHVS01107999.1.p1  ORF type:complete len:259 (-),score=64.08 GHVS01107999.1:514-1290(-)